MKEMKKTSKIGGFFLLIVSVTAFMIYAYFLLMTEFGLVILKLTVLTAVATLLAVLGWIGYTIITAPQSKNIS
jgi:predicted DNA-binding transcriptional regulator